MKNYCKFGNDNCKIAENLTRLNNQSNLSELDKQLLNACKTICSKCNDERYREKTRETESGPKRNHRSRDEGI